MWQICCYPNVYIYIFLSELIVSALSLGSTVAFSLVAHHQYQLEFLKITSRRWYLTDVDQHPGSPISKRSSYISKCILFASSLKQSLWKCRLLRWRNPERVVDWVAGTKQGNQTKFHQTYNGEIRVWTWRNYERHLWHELLSYASPSACPVDQKLNNSHAEVWDAPQKRIPLTAVDIRNFIYSRLKPPNFVGNQLINWNRCCTAW